MAVVSTGVLLRVNLFLGVCCSACSLLIHRFNSLEQNRRGFDAARGSLTSYTALRTTAVSDWAVAQMSDYEEIFTNLGSTTGDNGDMTYDANVNAYITTGVGGTALSGDYWSATKNNIADLAYCFGSVIGWGLNGMSVSYSVRPVLGF